MQPGTSHNRGRGGEIVGDGYFGWRYTRKLVNTILFLFGIHFALCGGGDKHKCLKVGCTQQILIKTDPENDLQFLEYKACHAKNNQGGLRDQKHQQKVVHAYENVNNKLRCVVRLYQKYLSLCPNNHPKCSRDMYLHPLAKAPQNGPWYSCQPMGIHSIEQVLSGLCAHAGIAGKCTNHALKATCATHLYNKGFDEQMIQEQLGNSSEAVRAYKQMNSQQKVNILQALYSEKKQRSKWNQMWNQQKVFFKMSLKIVRVMFLWIQPM